jgi:hypothetical protein
VGVAARVQQTLLSHYQRAAGTGRQRKQRSAQGQQALQQCITLLSKQPMPMTHGCSLTA